MNALSEYACIATILSDPPRVVRRTIRANDAAQALDMCLRSTRFAEGVPPEVAIMVRLAEDEGEAFRRDDKWLPKDRRGRGKP